MKISLHGRIKMNDWTTEKFFCSASVRPAEYCKVEANRCCFSCEYNAECTASIKNHNSKSTKKIPLPCTAQVVSKTETCEFAI